MRIISQTAAVSKYSAVITMKIVIDIDVPDGSLEPDILDIEDEIRDVLDWMILKRSIEGYEMEVNSL